MPNVSDPRLAKIFENPDFHVDPTLPQFSNTKGMNAFLSEKRDRKRRKVPSAARTVSDRNTCIKCLS